MINSKRMGHIAVEVENIQDAVEYYTHHFPFDVEYAYEDWGLLRHRLTGDDLALLKKGGKHHPHLGFRMENNEDVDVAYYEFKNKGLKLLTEPKLHRDKSYSFYMADLYGNVLEVIHDPNNP